MMRDTIAVLGAVAWGAALANVATQGHARRRGCMWRRWRDQETGRIFPLCCWRLRR
jgi:glycerol-3-phosphate dehydrogenase